MTRVAERIDELYQQCCGPNGSVDLRTIFKVLWSSLNNQVSLVDLAGVFAVSIPGSSSSEVLARDIFPDFIRAFARLRYPSGNDFCEKLLDEIGGSRGPRLANESGMLSMLADKQVIRVLLKYDLPLRKAFSVFCAQGMRSGGMVSWDEVRRLLLGMELDGFLSFCGAYSVVPAHFSAAQCEAMYKEVTSKFVLSSAAPALHSAILYPQFQLLLALMACERGEAAARKQDKGDKDRVFARKEGKGRPLVDQLADLFRDIGISKFDTADSGGLALPIIQQRTSAIAHEELAAARSSSSASHTLRGAVVQPSSIRATDMYQSAGNHAKQSMLLRMEHLLDEVEAQLISKLPADAPVLQLLVGTSEEVLHQAADSKLRLPSKPTVIGDAVPVPSACPETVEQLLEAALAHHNLGAFQEALKFLEAARIQLGEVIAQSTGQGDFFDVTMYITLCKGNVYVSCGDDEQALLLYIDGWTQARKHGDGDWEVICVNSAGSLAFYSLRYDVALLCFNAVVLFRETAYGADSPDTATAWNNEACALYCLQRRGEARLRFERAWQVLTAGLGHRAPRAVAVWKNLEKARRSHAPLHTKQDLADSVALRGDAAHLLIGSFTIAALPPPNEGKGKKKKGGGGKKKKKK